MLFKDRCTNEMAMYPPVQAPQQTSMVEPQPQVSYAPQSQATYASQPQASYVPTYPPQARPVAR